jgi:nitrogen regulatory protein PII 2
MLKEVLAIIRPERWAQTKARLQRLPLAALTVNRVLGRGRERGLRYLPRQGAGLQTAIRYLPKRMVSWIVEEAQVEPLVTAIIETNQTGQLGDGKIFVLPIDGAIRLRTGEHGLEALQTQQPFEMVMGQVQQPSDTQELAHAPRE